MEKEWYEINGRKLFRVTSIIGFCEKAEQSPSLLNWREREGEENAARITNRASSIGKKNHKLFEKFYADPPKFRELFYEYQTKSVTDEIYQDTLKYWQNCVEFVRFYKSMLSEFRVDFFDHSLQRGYAGTADSFGYMTENVLFWDKQCTQQMNIANSKLVFDLKNKARHKFAKDQYLIKYCLQLGAYSLAKNTMHPTREPVLEGLILIASPRQTNIHYLNEAKLKFYQQEFLNCLDYFYRKDKSYDWKDLELRCGYRWDAELKRPFFDKEHTLPTRVYLQGATNQ